MSRIIFGSPEGSKIDNPSPEFVESLILSPPDGYWLNGSGDGSLTYETTEGDKTELLILPNSDFGVYLKYHILDSKGIAKATWLSLEDRSRLTEVAECADEWYASVGLFIPAAKAAEAVGYFCRTGERTPKVEWIDPSEIPEGGNW